MQVKLAENIRAFRKERRLTQEQLAEVMRVTVGAVSKWEAGLSTPELGLIVEMAGFFETSVDVLLGYEWHKSSQAEYLQRIRALRNAKNYDEASSEAEKALQKYPNSFELVFRCAVLYSMKGLEHKDNKSYQRALTLFERSLELIEQNADPRINEWSIKNHIASVYLGLGQVDKALEQMKANNADGLNNGDIGFYMASHHKDPDEALTYLSDALIANVSNLFTNVIGYTNAYLDKKDHTSALAITLWMDEVIGGLMQPGRVSYINKEAALLMSSAAQISTLQGDRAGAKEHMLKAIEHAKIFDAAPDYGFCNTRFFNGDKATTAFDDFGTSALEGVRVSFTENEETREELSALWSELTQ